MNQEALGNMVGIGIGAGVFLMMLRMLDEMGKKKEEESKKVV